jgi:lysophospholipase L1-like esterase
MHYRRQYIGDFERCQRDHPDWPVVIAEGDSWFSFANVIGQLDDPGDLGGKNQRAWSLLRLDKGGDEILTILSGAQRSKLRDYFERWPLDALLFSGGGNDIIGPDLLPLLREYQEGMQAPDMVAFSRFERRLRQIQDCYRELLDMLSDAGQQAKVFVNSYDYTIPSDRPVKLFGILTVAGPWLSKYMAERKIPAALQGSVVKLLIDAFAGTIDSLALEARGAGRLIRVETRGVVGQNWKDEIHPNRRGAIDVAAAFEAALRREQIL